MMRFGRTKYNIWFGFFVFWLIVTAFAVALSSYVYSLVAAEQKSRTRAAIEENMRLSLWRIDSSMGPLLFNLSIAQGTTENLFISQESEPTAAPSWSHLSAPIVIDKIPVSTKLHVAFLDRKVISLQEPKGSSSDLALLSSALPTFESWHGLKHALERSAQSRSMIQIPNQEIELQAENPNSESGSLLTPPELSMSGPSQQLNRRLADSEFSQRSLTNAANNYLATRNTASIRSIRPLTPLWYEGQLFLLRNEANAEEQLFGYQVEWDSLRTMLKRSISDLLPEAQFEPVLDAKIDAGPDKLATLPILLLPGGEVGTSSQVESASSIPGIYVLIATWAGLLISMIASGTLMAGLLRLDEKRERFVAAVTHELRTPLTTLQLYTEMLSNGMIEDEATRGSYLNALQSEVVRIGHLVENVFAYARLDYGRREIAMEFLPLEKAVHRAEERMQTVCLRYGVEWVKNVELDCHRWIRVNETVLDQILLNLVDNACKYACNEIARVEWSVRVLKDHVELELRDFGPGFPLDRQWLIPFRKSVQQAAESAPGIGLGLSLSQRLAKKIHGSLTIQNHSRGGMAILSLPTAAPEIEATMREE